MKPETSSAIQTMVMDITQLNHRQSRRVVRMMEVKHDIEQGNIKAALESLLEFVLRDGDSGWITTMDDLTKLLNMQVPKAGNMSARELLNNGTSR